uniref:Mesencephalic astrocyte-derived neurotrophic factor homolog n=1 Tax=Aceria tosichella TaxID=561515 RepID=A0A6G1S5R8_9ACAR
MTNSSRFLVVGIILSAIMTTFSKTLQDSECPVCFSIVQKLREDLKKDSLPPTKENYSTAFLHLCDTAANDSAESKFCYYMGGQDVSATRTYKEMAERLGAGLPNDKVCELLRSRDSQICEIKEKKPIDLNTVDLKKLKVADLKRILKERGESCDGCFEKAEFIKKVEAIKAREEL